MKYIILAIALTCFLTSANCQEYKFGKVSKEELAQTVHHTDSSASAAVLYRYEYISFVFTQSNGFNQEREVHERIKIYSKADEDWATVKVYLYRGGSGRTEKISGLKGFTFNLNGNKIEKVKLRNDGIFEEEYNDFTKVVSFTLPNVKNGSVIEYSYKIESPFYAIDDIHLQKTIPIDQLDVTIATPEYLRYNSLLNPKALFVPTIKKKKQRKTGSYITSSRNNSAWVSGSNNYSGERFEYEEFMMTIKEVNIPGLKREKYSGSINNYTARLSFELAAILDAYGTVEQSFTTSWSEIAKTIYSSDKFGGQMQRTGFFKDDIAPLISGITDPFQIGFVLQSYVKSKVKWNGIHSYLALKGIKDTYKEGSGSVGDINLLLITMLNSVGVDAYPVLISTQDNGIPLFPTRNGFNYVVCMVTSNDNYALLDASDPFSTVNILPQKALNWQGRLIEKDGSSQWVDIMPSKKSKQTTMLNVKMHKDLSITGKVSQNLTSNLALNYRNNYTQLSKEDHIKRLENGKGDIEISNIDYQNAYDINKPVTVSYEYGLNDGIDDIANNLYFSPLLFIKYDENPFKLETRNYPIDFTIPFEEKFLVNIALPEGYKVESVPENTTMVFKNNDAKFSYLINQNGSYLQLKVEMKINNPVIVPQDYADFKTFFSKIVDKHTEQVVLTKTQI